MHAIATMVTPMSLTGSEVKSALARLAMIKDGSRT